MLSQHCCFGIEYDWGGESILNISVTTSDILIIINMACLLMLLYMLTLFVNPVLTARIAGFHVVGGSQYMNMRQMLEELSSRGHEVVYKKIIGFPF